MPNYPEKLGAAIANRDSRLCLGLDPDPARIPRAKLVQFNRAAILATRDLAAAYKPNFAFYEAQGRPGLQALEKTLALLRMHAPGALILGDAKRGDLGPSAKAYAQALYQEMDLDAATLNPWSGLKSLEPFLADPEKGAYLWLRGSQPQYTEPQDLLVASPEGTRPLYRHLAERIQERWPENPAWGLVVGANALPALAAVGKLCPRRPLLLPGVGAQGANLPAAFAAVGPAALATDLILVSSSRSLLYAGDGSAGQPEEIRAAAAGLKQEINAARQAALAAALPR